MAHGGSQSPTGIKRENVINRGTIMGAGEGVRLERSSTRQTFDSVESDECLDSDDYADTSIDEVNEALRETNLALARRIEVLLLKANIDEKQHDEEKRRIALIKDTEINMLQIAGKRKDERMESLEDELWNAQQQIHEFRDVKKALEEAKENIKKLKEENNDLNKEKRNFKKELQDMRKVCDSINSELNDKYEEISVLKQNTIQTLKREILSANERIEQLIDHQKKQGVRYEAENAKHAAERVAVCKKMDEMHNEMKEMKSMIKHLLQKEAEAVPKNNVEIFGEENNRKKREKK